MPAIAHSLFALTAQDLMSREELTLSPWMSVQSAVRALTRVRAGGAPVVDERRRCVGVFSLSDCSRLVHNANRHVRPSPPIPGCVCCEWEVVEEGWDNLPADAVSRYMASDPVLVLPETPLGEVAQMMTDSHIHQLIVVTEDRRPVGIVSSTDVLAAVARAAREQA